MSKIERIDYLTKQMMTATGNAVYINVSQFAKVMGMSRARASEILAQLRWIENGREKLFLIIDVADTLCMMS